uniref:Guanylate cyclase n=1 Tax=Saccoglossus kowalevskii TaxID=10224 RepID=A0ABM0M6S0_SACKO
MQLPIVNINACAALIWICWLCQYLRQIETREFHLGLLLPWDGFWPVGKHAAGAALVAIDFINADAQFSAIHTNGHNLSLAWRDDKCDVGVGLSQLVDLWSVKYDGNHLDAFIGPGCSIICEPGGLLASQWGVPMVSWGCASSALSNKIEYPTFARTVAPMTRTADFVLQIMLHFNWTRVAIITTAESVWQLTANALSKKLIENNIEVPEFHIFYSSDELTKYENMKSGYQALEEAKSSSRIFILCAYGRDVRHLLLSAYDLRMTEGEYAFFTLQVSLDSYYSASIDMEDDRNGDAALPFEGKHMVTMVTWTEKEEWLMDISVYEPDGDSAYQQFHSQVRSKLREDPFNYNLPDNEAISTEAAMIYEAVLLYAVALNESLAQGVDQYDTTNISRRLFDRNFTGLYGEAYIDHHGDRSLNYMLRNVQNGSYIHVADYFVSDGVYRDVSHSVVWPGSSQSPPQDRPSCSADICQQDSFDKISVVAVVCSVVGLAIVSIVGYIVYRNRKYEEDLMNKLWKINFYDIQFTDTGSKTHFGSKISHSSKFSNDTAVQSTTNSHEGAQMFTRVGRYQSNLVAIKPVRKKSVHITRELLMEFKELRDLRHANINQFVGACVDAPEICIVTHYCSKGSLQDVLENDNIKLDWLFKLSFASDIAKGMAYLHASPIQSHGNLKSTNCLIDSRWVCKITDFDLIRFREGQTEIKYTHYIEYARKLWTAPELLNMGDTPLKGTQKGDVYSFGIILQEIVVRGGPYCMFNMEPEDIISRVKDGTSPYFRPKVPLDSGDERILDLMRICWEQIPAFRPNFSTIADSLKKMNKGRQTTLIDNMISMMEKYADHLEDLVEERTRQLAEEQKKTDELLYRMLPRSVAEQLKQGRVVEPENFAKVTIFFSDIVGFTQLAGDSSPMQVVDVLNDLYTCFDTILENYDVYKVETIGDAYMVVSGLPIRNSNKHAGEICTMALDLLSSMRTFKIRHKSDMQLQLRIGIHTGPCVAGVVGLKMPRYCLFGDTVNYASRMESTGLALRIHISAACREVLMQLGGFYFEERGDVYIKGKGKVNTWFLIGKKGFNKPLPVVNSACINEHHF